MLHRLFYCITLLVFGIFCIPVIHAQCRADAGELFHDGRCYRFINSPMAYEQARIFCDLLQYYLVSISDAFSNSFVGDSASKNLNTTGNFWIGLEKWRDGNFHWADESNVTYLNWASGQPDQNWGYTAFDLSNNKWLTMNNATLLPFICATNPIHHLTTPPSDATTPGKTCAGNLGYEEKQGFCYEGIYSVGWNEFRTAEQDCAAMGHGCHMVSITSKDENDYVNFIFGGFSFIWIGLTGSSTKNVTWTDGSPLNYTNWWSDDGTFRNYGCTTGDCCAVMVPSEPLLYGIACGMWFLEDCVKEPSDYSVDGSVCKSPYY